MKPFRRIKLAQPSITEAEEQAAIEVLRSGQLVAGSKVLELENKIASMTGRRFAVALSSGTAALLAAMDAFGIRPGKTVVVPAFTFPAPAIAAAFLGAKVRLCDVELDTMNLSPRTLEPVLDENTSLVIAVDQFGLPAPSKDLTEMLDPLGIPLLVDAACSLGSRLHGLPCGSMGNAATFSFHPRKVITTCEGGMVVTDDEDLAKTVRRFRNIGIEDGVFHGTGLNLRPSEFGAAIGLCQLERLNAMIARRKKLTSLYSGLPLTFQAQPQGFESNFQTLATLLPAKMDRGSLMDFLRVCGIECQVASYSINRLEPLKSRLGIEEANTPNADYAHFLGVALPMHEKLTDDDVDYIADMVQDWLFRNEVAK